MPEVAVYPYGLVKITHEHVVLERLDGLDEMLICERLWHIVSSYNRVIDFKYKKILRKRVTIANNCGIIGRNRQKTDNMKSTSNSGRFEIIDGKCVIPEGVTEIADHEFHSVHELHEVVIPNSVIRIGQDSFDSTGLGEIKIPDSIKIIEHGAFSSCFGLSKVELSESLVSIGDYAFSDCPIRSIKLPGTLAHLGRSSFGASNLVSIHIPSSVVSIGHGAFSDCSELERISVDENNPMYRSVSDTCLTKNGDTLVFGCKNSIIPKGVKYIGAESFEGCWGLESIEMSDSVTHISYAAFSKCRNLKCVKLPKMLESIEKEAFGYCKKLVKPEIPASVINIADDAFLLAEGGDDLPF